MIWFNNMIKGFLILFTTFIFLACNRKNTERISPVFITEQTLNDTDDPAIWYNRSDPEKSLILGTDKGDEDGGLYVFDLEGKIISSKAVTGLKRPNNVDVAYDFVYRGKKVDIAVFTERGRNVIRVFALPDMLAIDGGGISVFEGESLREPMGIALFHDSISNQLYAIISRKSGPDSTYLWQYRLVDSSDIIAGTLVRKFGRFEGGKEIEAIAVDQKLGFVYYSDEGKGVRKYFAHPDSANNELSIFGTTEFKEDHEGITLYPVTDSTGFILVSDQQKNVFQVFSREGIPGNPHAHSHITSLKLSTIASDGSELHRGPFGSKFPHGIFVAMSDDRTFHIYNLSDLIQRILKEDK